MEVDLSSGHHPELYRERRTVQPEFVAPGDVVFAASPGKPGSGEIEVEDPDKGIISAADLHPQAEVDVHLALHEKSGRMFAGYLEVELVLEPFALSVYPVQPSVGVDAERKAG